MKMGLFRKISSTARQDRSTIPLESMVSEIQSDSYLETRELMDQQICTSSQSP